MYFKDKFLPALKRAAWTAIEFGIGTAIIAIPVGAALDEVDWMRLVSIAVVATIVSFLKSILLSMPEVNQEAEITQLKEDIQKLIGYHEENVVSIVTDPTEVDEILECDDINPEPEEDAFGPAESEDTKEVDDE